MRPRILIADDHAAMLKVIRAALEYNSRFEVCGAVANGGQAVTAARDLRPDLIILDLAMPVMNGLDAARKIAGFLPDVPILLFTMIDIPQVKLEAATAGIREVLFKAAGIVPLVEAVERALVQKRSAGTPENSTTLPPTVLAHETTVGSVLTEPAMIEPATSEPGTTGSLAMDSATTDSAQPASELSSPDRFEIS